MNILRIGKGEKERGIGPQVEATVKPESYPLSQPALEMREEDRQM